MRTTVDTQSDKFTEQQLKDISENNDCHIDDPRLMSECKHLQTKFTPISLIHAIMGKVKDSGIGFQQAERKNPEDMKTMLFSYFVNLPSSNIVGFAEEPQKRYAQQRGCQNFLKKLFPEGTTWNDCINIT